MNPQTDAPGGLEYFRRLLSLVRFEHTLFALPFILVAMLVAAGGLPTAGQLIWILVAAVGARTSAMAFNRIVDRHLDARNPRTRRRELPAGRVSLQAAVGLAVIAAAVFVLAAGMLNRLCLYLSFPALAVLWGYSYSKRFTSLSHAWLGLCLSIGPVGAWLAITGEFSAAPLILAAGVMCWVTGFDIIYATLDREFDRREGLHSAVRSLGLSRALVLAALLHGGFLVYLTLFGAVAGLTWRFFLGVVAVGGLMVYEHAIVSESDLSRVNDAFFTANAVASLAVLGATVADLAGR
jgi:4-hydroxybenzoate polyprenyltransferase